jgi:predicted TPR repeat methyltransferase
MDGLASADHTILAERARALLAAGRPGAAGPLIAALRAPLAGTGELAELEAKLHLARGNAAAACAVLDPAIAMEPRTSLLLARAEARLRCDDAAGAAADAADAVIAARDSADAKAILGIALIDLGRNEDAIPCLDEAVAARPANPWFREALATALERQGEAATAARVLADGIALAPAHPGLRTAAILLALRGGDAAEALDFAEAARREGAVDARVMGLLGHALSELGRHEEAALIYAEAHKLGPEDLYVRHLAATAGMRPVEGTAPAAYVTAVFDGWASRFDHDIIGLHYRIPGVMRQMLSRRATAEPWLDLGCGTGLVALALGDLAAGPATGVDLSAAMLREAAAKNLYAELIEAEATSFLAGDRRHWALITAADLLCYIGDLRPLLEGVRARLVPGGCFLASVELADETGRWMLGPRGRFSHGRAMLEAALSDSGFQIAEVREEALRLEAGKPVQGLIFLATARAAYA